MPVGRAGREAPCQGAGEGNSDRICQPPSMGKTSESLQGMGCVSPGRRVASGGKGPGTMAPAGRGETSMAAVSAALWLSGEQGRDKGNPLDEGRHQGGRLVGEGASPKLWGRRTKGE